MIYSNVKDLCEVNGISVAKLEDELGFPRSSICKWNKNEPGVMRVQKVADYFQVPIEVILNGNSNVSSKGVKCTVDELLADAVAP